MFNMPAAAPAARSKGMNAWLLCISPNTFTSYMARTSSIFSNSNGSRHEMPALLTSPTSCSPSFARSAATAAAAALHWASSTTSTSTGRSDGRSAFNASASDCFRTPAKTVKLRCVRTRARVSRGSAGAGGGRREKMKMKECHAQHTHPRASSVSAASFPMPLLAPVITIAPVCGSGTGNSFRFAR